MHGWASSTRGVLAERLHFLGLVVDGAGVLGAEVGVKSCVFEWKIVVAQECELVDGESESPREVCRLKVLGRGVGHRGERHVSSEFM